MEPKIIKCKDQNEKLYEIIEKYPENFDPFVDKPYWVTSDGENVELRSRKSFLLSDGTVIEIVTS